MCKYVSFRPRAIPFKHLAIFPLSHVTRNDLDSRISMAVGLDHESMPSLGIIRRLAVDIALTLVWITIEKWQIDNSITPCIAVPYTSCFSCKSYDGE